jgi:hypothetical protein
MTIKIEVFTNSGMYEIEEEIRGFPSAQAAADYRDHDDRLCYKYTKLAQDESQPVYYGPMNAMEADGTEGTGAGKAQVIQYHDEAGHRWANFRFIGLVFIFFICFLISGVSVLFNGFGW